MHTTGPRRIIRAHPARHRAGKALSGPIESASDSDSDHEHSSEGGSSNEVENTGPIRHLGLINQRSSPIPVTRIVYAPAQTTTQGSDQAHLPKGRPSEGGASTVSQSSSGDEGEEEEEQEESDVDSSSGDDNRRKFLRPVFVKKSLRTEITPNQTIPDKSLRTAAEYAHLSKTDVMIQDQLDKNLQARQLGKTFWDDENAVDEIDDSDDNNAVESFTAWKLREYKRVKRDRDVLIAAEQQREEVERRRNLTAQERQAEDQEFLSVQAEQRENRGQMGFMQKYYHKGAFHANAEITMNERNIMAGRYVDDVADRAALPQYMQIRDMTKLGRKGRTRYKDMKSEDTGQFGTMGNSDRRSSREFFHSNNTITAGESFNTIHTSAGDKGVGMAKKRQAISTDTASDKRTRIT